VSLLFRVDDFPLTKPEESHVHTFDRFVYFHETMMRHVESYVLAVIPRHTTAVHLRWLGEQVRAGHLEVAMHGLDHDERFPNEFRDHQSRSDRGKAIGEVQALWWPFVGQVTKYVPPHNVIDMKTCQALSNLGFKLVLGGPGSDLPTLNMARMIGLDYHYSNPPHEYGRSDEMIRAGSASFLRDMVECPDVEICCTFHWTWENNISNGDFHQLDELLTGVFR
jgi:hypothetical protein